MTDTDLTLLNLLEAASAEEGEVLTAFDRENKFGDDDEETYGLGWNIREMLEVLTPWGMVPTRPTLGGVEIVEEKSWGGEGEGDSIGYVFKHGDVYVEVSGYYSSYDGAYWDDASITEVEPREVTVTKFFPKDSK